jgi:hypothetical protein
MVLLCWKTNRPCPYSEDTYGLEWYRNLSLYLYARWRWWVTSRPARFVPGKRSRYLLERKMGESHNRSRLLEKRKTSLTLPEFKLRSFQSLAQWLNQWKCILQRNIFQYSKKCVLWPRPWDKPTFTYLNLKTFVWLATEGIFLLIWNLGSFACDYLFELAAAALL